VSGAKRHILDTVHARMDFPETIAAIETVSRIASGL
jgi:hypothetical protein